MWRTEITLQNFISNFIRYIFLLLVPTRIHAKVLLLIKWVWFFFTSRHVQLIIIMFLAEIDVTTQRTKYRGTSYNSISTPLNHCQHATNTTKYRGTSYNSISTSLNHCQHATNTNKYRGTSYNSISMIST